MACMTGTLHEGDLGSGTAEDRMLDVITAPARALGSVVYEFLAVSSHLLIVHCADTVHYG